MTELESLTTILDLIQSFGIWVVFFWLYVQSERNHESTRQAYRHDLREIAGFHGNVRVPNTPTPPPQDEPQKQ